MKAVIESIIDWTSHLRTIRMRPEKPLLFKPGQFIMLSHPDHPHKRAYSLCSIPGDDFIEIALSHTIGGRLSPKIFECKVGDELFFEGPFGKFTFEKGKDNVFIAGGTGIAPLMSMLRSIKKENSRPIFIYGARNPSSILYREELESLEKETRLHLTLVVQEPNDTWNGEVGVITKDILNKKAPPKVGRTYYLCGPPAMIKAIEIELANLGASSVRTEKWE